LHRKKSAVPGMLEEDVDEEEERDLVASSLGRGRSNKGKGRAVPSTCTSASTVPPVDHFPPTTIPNVSPAGVPQLAPQSVLPPPPAISPPPLREESVPARGTRDTTAEVKERVRARPGASKRVTGVFHLSYSFMPALVRRLTPFPSHPEQERLIKLHRYDPHRDTRRKAYTTGVDSLLASSRKFAIKTNATVYLFVASHEVFNAADGSAPIVNALQTQPVMWPPSPTEAELSADDREPAQWAKFTLDCPTFTPAGSSAFDEVLTPVGAVFERMLTMFEAVVGPGQTLEAQVRKAASAGARKARHAPKARLKEDSREEGKEGRVNGRIAALELENEAMAALLRRLGATEEQIRVAQAHAQMDAP
ncbi:hypothetical protein P7C70_g6710, partial [Phenoliferia sp. Uapishka_3]